MVELAEGKGKGVHAQGLVGRGRKKKGVGKVGKEYIVWPLVEPG